jgi:hypothetical protein
VIAAMPIILVAVVSSLRGPLNLLGLDHWVPSLTSLHQFAAMFRTV